MSDYTFPTIPPHTDDNGAVVAQAAIVRDSGGSADGLHRFTAWVEFEDEYEEIDCDATTQAMALRWVRAEVANNYAAGGRIHAVEARSGLYM